MTNTDTEIKKLYYSISEVCKLTDLKSYVLRYWETEFRELNPPKNRAGNRTYRKKDIDTINKIKELLYDKKFTIEGARNQLAITPNIASSSDDNISEKRATVVQSNKEASVLLEVRDQLKSILDIINS
jgi:DNA-binding transcriptional MerR regulator